MKKIKENFEAYCNYCKKEQEHIVFEDSENEEIDDDTGKPFDILYSECLACGTRDFADY